MFPFPTYVYFEIAAFLISVFFWHKIKATKLRLLPFYLLIIVTAEICARYVTKVLGHVSNGWIYNISVPVEYLFYGWLFYHYFNSIKYKKIAFVFLCIFPFFVLINIFFVQGFFVFNNNFLKAGSFCMIAFCCLYFIDILKIEKIIDPLRSPFFWIVSGLFIFNVGEFVYITLSNILFADWKNFRGLVKMINNNLIYVLYSAITTGLILAKWDQEEKI